MLNPHLYPWVHWYRRICPSVFECANFQCNLFVLLPELFELLVHFMFNGGEGEEGEDCKVTPAQLLACVGELPRGGKSPA